MKKEKGKAKAEKQKVNEDNAIGHFRVPKNLTFKARLSAKPLI